MAGIPGQEPAQAGLIAGGLGMRIAPFSKTTTAGNWIADILVCLGTSVAPQADKNVRAPEMCEMRTAWTPEQIWTASLGITGSRRDQLQPNHSGLAAARPRCGRGGSGSDFLRAGLGRLLPAAAQNINAHEKD